MQSTKEAHMGQRGLEPLLGKKIKGANAKWLGSIELLPSEILEMRFTSEHVFLCLLVLGNAITSPLCSALHQTLSDAFYLLLNFLLPPAIACIYALKAISNIKLF